jgi:hypothetical protein
VGDGGGEGYGVIGAFQAGVVGSQVGLWTPANITTELWLDGLDTQSITLDTGVSQWKDKSGNERHVSQAVAANQPSYNAGWLTFDTTDVLASSSFTPADNSVTVFCVVDVADWNGAILHFGWDNNGSFVQYFGVLNSYEYYFAQKTNTGPALYGQSIATSPMVLVTQSFPANSVFKQRFFGTEFSASKNSGTEPLGTYPAILGNTGLTATNGGKIAEVGFCTGTVSADTVTKIEGYLAHKWGLNSSLPSDHPYKSAPPRI